MSDQRVALPLADVYNIALAVGVLNQFRERGSDPLRMPEIFKAPAEPVPVTDDDRARAEAMLSDW